MATNFYFSQRVKSEQNLYEDLVIESLKMMGQDVMYLPRTLRKVDKIFKDDAVSAFSDAFKIEMYPENVDGFGGEGDLFQKFGLEIRDQISLIVSRRRWRQAVGQNIRNGNDDSEPQEGDLIYFALSDSIFEIMKVEKESPFYQLSNVSVYRLECELFEYSDEQMDTGIPAIDKVETLGYTSYLRLNADSDEFDIIIGDTVRQNFLSGAQVSGEIIEWNKQTQILGVARISTNDGGLHFFTPGGRIIFSSIPFSREVLEVQEDLGDFIMQNKDFKEAKDDFMDFTFNNPFGNPI